MQIEYRAYVQFTGRGVAVERGLEPKGSQDGLEPGDVFGETIRSDADVLNARGGLCRTRAAGQQREAGLPQLPHQLLSLRV